jgi:hypothetical protein
MCMGQLTIGAVVAAAAGADNLVSGRAGWLGDGRAEALARTAVPRLATRADTSRGLAALLVEPAAVLATAGAGVLDGCLPDAHSGCQAKEATEAEEDGELHN